MPKGFFISFEGGEGAGKTVIIAKIVEYLRVKGKDVVLTREPGGTQISEQIREVILSTKNKKISPWTEALLFQVARAQNTAEIILPALKEGKIVLTDRYRDSSVVYQGIVRGLGIDLIEKLNDVSTRHTKPDLVILLDVPVEIGLKRRTGTKKIDRIDMEEKSFHEKVRQGYLDWADKNKDRIVVIDGTGSIEAVTEEVIKLIEIKLQH